MNARAPLTLLTLAVALAAPVAAQADPARSFLFTGDGVSPDVGRFAIEGNATFGGVISDSGSRGSLGALPTLGLRYAHGLTDNIDFRASLNTLAIYNQVDLGLGVAVIKTPNFGFGLRAGATSHWIFAGGAAGVFAATPGAVVTLRGSSAALSFGVDVPMFFNGFVVTDGSSSAGGGFVPSIRPNFALEIGSGTRFYIRGEADVFLAQTQTAVLGSLSVGFHF